MTLRLSRKDGETWRETAVRYGEAHRLGEEVAASYDENVKQGFPPQDSAWEACFEWDVLDFVDEPA